MFSLEPPRTAWDLHFSVFGIPTRIHPAFWLVAFILGFNGSQGGKNPLPVLIFIGVLFVSILIHELGHALLMRRYGFAPRIVLYHMGGLAIPDQGFSMGFERRRTRRDTWSSILISFAGPGAGFVFAALVILLVFVGGGKFAFDWSRFPEPWRVTPGANWPDAVHYLVYSLLFVNIFWGLVNLIPVFPLDGGQIARELLTHRDRQNGMIHTLQLSIGVAIVVAAFMWMVLDQPYAAVMFALLAVNSYLMLQQLGRMY
jgi:stage IV sporulation protein FB